MKYDIDNFIQNKVFFLLLIISYVAVRLLIFYSTDVILVWFDSYDNLRIADHPLISTVFWTENRPPFYPLVLKIFTSETTVPTIANLVQGQGFTINSTWMPQLSRYLNANALSLFQLTASIISWSYLAVVLTFLTKHKYSSILLATGILIYSCSSVVTIWDRQILTESLSISLMIGMIAALLHFYISKSRTAFIVYFILLIPFTLIKSLHPYIAVMLLLIWVIFLLNKLIDKNQLVLIGAVTIFLFVINGNLATSGYRHYVPFVNVLTGRIMHSEFTPVYDAFKNDGMPSVPSTYKDQLWRAPLSKNPPLLNWVMDDAVNSYRKYLLTNPTYFIFAPFDKYRDIKNVPVPEAWGMRLTSYQIEEMPWFWFDAGNSFLWMLLGIIGGGGLIILISGKQKQGITGIISVLYLIGLLVSILAWHADYIEIERHLLIGRILIIVANILLLGFCLDLLLNRKE